MSFEITILGSSGGPLEGSTCSILLKPANISYHDIINDNLPDQVLCIDAGSGMGKLTEIIHQETTTKTSYCNFLQYYPDCETVSYYYHPNVTITTPFSNFQPGRPILHTQNIFNNLQNYLISHSHLDHVCSVVINSAGFNKNMLNKILYGSHYTINAMQQHLFNGKIWPNMPSFKIVNLNYLESNRSERIGIYTVKMFDLSHGEFNKLTEDKEDAQHHSNSNSNSNNIWGKRYDRRRSSITTIPQNTSGLIIKNSEALNHHYLSSAFLITLEVPCTTKEPPPSILVFGDFESDLTSKLSRNLFIWKSIAPLILRNQLKAIVLECSNCKEIAANELYGHLTPKLLIYELKQLEHECKQLDTATTSTEQPLLGLNVIVNHVKEPIADPNQESQLHDPRKRILAELNKLNEIEKLGCNISIALSGTSIIV